MHPNDGRVISSFVLQALRGQPITIFGSGEQTRSFCYVDDLVDALMRLMASDDALVGPVNLGNPEEYTILQIAQEILALTGSASKIEFLPLPSDDPQRRQPEISLARKRLAWEPRTSLRDGLVRTIAYFEQLLSVPGRALKIDRAS
jgi:UDP-glucuronate decarboxylase